MGHIISVNEISIYPGKIFVVKDWPKATNVSQLRMFLGLASYYLFGQTFLLRTNHHSLVWLFRQVVRWFEQLQDYNFTVQHRVEKLHANADALSHRSCILPALQPG